MCLTSLWVVLTTLIACAAFSSSTEQKSHFLSKFPERKPEQISPNFHLKLRYPTFKVVKGRGLSQLPQGKRVGGGGHTLNKQLDNHSHSN